MRTAPEEQRVERRIVSILFADLVGFTSLSEQLDAEDVATLQDAYFGVVRETIGRYGGRLEKFIGDAAMAVFGVPKARDDDAERAVRAGLALSSAVDLLSVKVGLAEGDLRLRVGVNTGEVLHSQTGAGDWRVTGDTVNVAARLQAAAPPGGVLVGEMSALATEQAVELDSVGTIELKGKAEPVRAWVATGVRPSPSREHAMGGLRAPILGREAELDLLAGALGRVAGGGSERVVIIAPPGVGKSRLLEGSGKAAEDRGAAVWRARLRPDLLAPFEPVSQLFASALAAGSALEKEKVAALIGERLASAGTSEARADVILQEVAEVLFPAKEGAAGSAHVDPGQRERRFLAWLEALDAVGGQAPAVWVVEDVHWAGGDLLAFLEMAGRTPIARGRLVLASSRPSLLERAPDWCAADTPGTTVLSLSPLSPTDAEALIRALVGDALQPELVMTVAERSDGNPLFIEELLRTWISAGILVRTDREQWRLVTSAGEVPIPSTVQSIYAAQLDDLPGPARQVARRASVAGRRFPLASLPPLGVEHVGPAVDVLHRRALVGGPVPDPLLGSSYVFRHALLRDAGYASLARAERALLHVRLARWLEQATGPRHVEVAEVIGNHYRAALDSAPRLSAEVGDGLSREGAGELAARWFEKAAEVAAEVAAHDAARALLHQALDLSPEHAGLDRARRWHRLGDATAFVDDLDLGIGAFRNAADGYLEILQDPGATGQHEAARDGYAAAVTSLGLALIQQTRFEEAVEIANQALDLIGPREDAGTGWLTYVRAWGTIAWAYRPDARADLEAALALAEATGARRLELEVRYTLLAVRMEEGELDLAEGDRLGCQLAALAEKNAQWDTASQMWRVRAIIRSEEGGEDWQEPLDRAIAIAEAHGLTEEAAWNDYGRAEIGLFRGDWDAAMEAGHTALDRADRHHYHRVQVRTWFALSPILLARHESLDRALRWFERHRPTLPRSPYGLFMQAAMDSRFAAAGIPVEPDVPADLLAFWDEIPGWASGYTAMETVIAEWLRRDQVELATTAVERAGRWVSHPAISPFYPALVTLIRSRVLFARGMRGWVEDLRRELGTFRRLKAPWWIAKGIRLIDRAGVASEEEVGEAALVERTLMLAEPAS